MLCCVGLIGGFAVGQSLGGPWTFIAPAAGFGIGLAADMKLMKGHHKMGDQHDTGVRAKKDTNPVCGREADESKAEHQVGHNVGTLLKSARRSIWPPQKILALVMDGGEGTRLYPLTANQENRQSPL